MVCFRYILVIVNNLLKGDNKGGDDDDDDNDDDDDDNNNNSSNNNAQNETLGSPIFLCISIPHSLQSQSRLYNHYSTHLPVLPIFPPVSG